MRGIHLIPIQSEQHLFLWSISWFSPSLTMIGSIGSPSYNLWVTLSSVRDTSFCTLNYFLLFTPLSKSLVPVNNVLADIRNIRGWGIGDCGRYDLPHIGHKRVLLQYLESLIVVTQDYALKPYIMCWSRKKKCLIFQVPYFWGPL